MFEIPDDEGRELEVVEVDIRSWVEAAAANPVLHRDRQVTEIVLASIGLAPTLKTSLVLKGGAAMALAFDSKRVTGDVDFSASVKPENFAEILTEELNEQFPRTAVELGYIDLVCRVQSIKKMPRPANFEEHKFPALRVKIGSALRGTRDEKRLDEGLATRIVEIEISFRDHVYSYQELKLSEAGASIRAFTVHEIVAEKLRALLQQPIRNRNRRQDVYDISYLKERYGLDSDDIAKIYKIFMEKCRTKGISPDQDSFDDPEVKKRAQADWETLALEVGDLPPFEERFAMVRELYGAMWP